MIAKDKFGKYNKQTGFSGLTRCYLALSTLFNNDRDQNCSRKRQTWGKYQAPGLILVSPVVIQARQLWSDVNNQISSDRAINDNRELQNGTCAQS